MSHLYRKLPSVDFVLDEIRDLPEFKLLQRSFLKELVNNFLDVCREEIKSGVCSAEEDLEFSKLKNKLLCFIKAHSKAHFRRVLNGTGVVVHTNLGRSILAESAVKAVENACRFYSNLEFDLETGERGSRYSHVEKLICEITGAESALVVNNNASAVLITLETLAAGKEVIVSRGQLVEIGGSFRIPDVMVKSGAILREVGATNRTHLKDYENAITDETNLLLKVHTSNYRIIGFTKEVSGAELSELGRQKNIPVYEDLGSGSLTSFSGLGLIDEPTVQEVVSQGVDVVSFSGDKVLGGPQAGIIVGRKEYIDKIKRNPLNRVVRIDKMTLAALEATLRLYNDVNEAKCEVPTVRMITEKYDTLCEKGAKLAEVISQYISAYANVELKDGESRVGGGSFPEQGLKTRLVAITPNGISVEDLKEELLRVDLPLAGRIEDNKFCVDPRTLVAEEYELVAKAIYDVLTKVGS